ncbi:hypothetical protein EV715DRAFT_278444 [Schizophyllum commune]
MAVSSTLSSSFLCRARATSAPPRLRATQGERRINPRASLPQATCTASQARMGKSRRIFCALWLTFVQGYGGRLNARSARIPPIFRLFGPRDSVADRRGLIRKYATPVWKIGRRLDAALGRWRSIKSRIPNGFNQYSAPFLILSTSHSAFPPFMDALRPQLNDCTSLPDPASKGRDGLDFRYRATLISLALGHHVDRRVSRPPPPFYHCLPRRRAQLARD